MSKKNNILYEYLLDDSDNSDDDITFELLDLTDINYDDDDESDTSEVDLSVNISVQKLSNQQTVDISQNVDKDTEINEEDIEYIDSDEEY